MSPKSEVIADLLDQFEDRLDRRHWAEDLSEGSVSRDDAVRIVGHVFQEQLGVLPTGKEVGAELVTGMLSYGKFLSSTTPTDDEIKSLIELARKDHDAYQVLSFHCQLADVNLNPALKDWKQSVYLGLVRAPRTPQGVNKYKNAHRNLIISDQIKQLRLAGFAPTRNAETAEAHRNSGCDIVSDALELVGLHLGYSAVETIWKKSATKTHVKPIAELPLGDK